MKNKSISFIFIGVFFICSCSKGFETATPEIDIDQDQEIEYTIPIEDALASLEEFLIENGITATKGGTNNYIDSYFPVSLPATKSFRSAGNILYAVNFKNDCGYALLSADSRIQEKILAVTDRGSVSETDFLEPSPERASTENDDLSVAEYDEILAPGILTLQANLVNLEVKSYAIRQLEAFHKDCKGNESTSETYSWKKTGEKPRMLNTAWAQRTSNDDIFNKYCPEVGLIWKTKAPAGCVCIAISQIIAFNEYPEMTCNGQEIDYPEIKKIYCYDNIWNEGSDAGKEMLARLCINVGELCKIKYHSIFGNSFGFAWPWDAKSCLEAFGYPNVSWNPGYDESLVIETLNNDCPVFISALSGFLQGHAWVIDGYIKRDYVSDKGTVKASQTLVHCNWGWHGNCNGYFTSGVFHTQEAETYDECLESTRDENYYCAFNTITYDSPSVVR